MYDFRLPNYKVREWKENGADYISVDIQKDSRRGILNFTHELTIDFKKKEDGHLAFLSAWELNCSDDVVYKPTELTEFEEDHPGLIADIELALTEGRVTR